jgi:hypothetical protein
MQSCISLVILVTRREKWLAFLAILGVQECYFYVLLLSLSVDFAEWSNAYSTLYFFA